MKIDLHSWQHARRVVETSIKKQKHKIRKESNGQASRDDWALLIQLKSTATRLYVIRATANGHEHSDYVAIPPAEFALKPMIVTV